jgi:4-diphosphocytidyl-2-C-methyl-D-erythritol kinase
MTEFRERAPGKVNLCLFLGPPRSDGRHELVTVFESISLADELELSVQDGAEDEVMCPEVPGPNLVADALAALRREGWSAPAVRISIHKRIPVAAGLGGGSADAAAALRMAQALEPLPDGLALRIARHLGADVPGQLAPGVSLGTGAGDIVSPLPPLAQHAFVIVPQPFELSTAAVYREADRLSLPRGASDLAERRQAVEAAVSAGGQRLPNVLAMNDLGRATLSLAPQISDALAAVRAAGAEQILVCGSGPTVAGIYWGERSDQAAEQAARRLRPTYPRAVAAAPFVFNAPSPAYGTIAGGP